MLNSVSCGFALHILLWVVVMEAVEVVIMMVVEVVVVLALSSSSLNGFLKHQE